MTNHLSGGKANISLVQEYLRKQLLLLLDKCHGTKAIVWDEALAGPVGLIAKYSLLREHEVTKMFHLKPGKLPPANVKNIIWITRPDLRLMDMIASNIHNEDTKTPFSKEYHIFFVPRKSLLCQHQLKNRGVYGNFTLLEEFRCDLFPMDSDVLSMELEGVFKELQLENDPGCLYSVAQAIRTLETVWGPIPRITGKGQACSQVYQLLERLHREQNNGAINGDEFNSTSSGPIDQILLLDRNIDLLSPLATQLTYEGLIDELFEISNTTAQFPSEKFSKEDANNSTAITDMTTTNEKKQIILNSGDELYAEIRDKNFHAIGPALSKKARLISSQFEERHADKTVQEIKHFVSRLPHMLAAKQSLATHTTIAELIKEETDSCCFLESLQLEQEFMNGIDTDKVHPILEDMIAQKMPLIKVLRLICMQSVTNSGLKPKVIEYYKREIVQSYGFQHLLSFINLEKCGLIKPQQNNRSFTILRKTLRLTVEDGSELQPQDCSYVHSVYAPITARLAQQAAKPNGWRPLADVFPLLPGPPVIDVIRANSSGNGVSIRRGSIASQASSQGDSPKVILVFFIGGCTFAEISALRFISQQEDSNVEFIIVTTKLINGNSFLRSLMETLVPDVKK